MSSNYINSIDSILPKYQAESAAANLVNYNTQAARSMYPYVSVTSHQLSSNAASNISPFSAMTGTTDADKQCRYSQTGATDMSQYGLNLQNCATTSNMAQYFHQNNVTNPINSCSQPAAPTPHIPDIPRYPWMSITVVTGPDCIKSLRRAKAPLSVLLKEKLTCNLQRLREYIFFRFNKLPFSQGMPLCYCYLISFSREALNL
ncbi:sequence-specific DNA binding, partial [Halocaridina rubra]